MDTKANLLSITSLLSQDVIKDNKGNIEFRIANKKIIFNWRFKTGDDRVSKFNVVAYGNNVAYLSKEYENKVKEESIKINKE